MHISLFESVMNFEAFRKEAHDDVQVCRNAKEALVLHT